jgi:ERF superfamily
MRTSELTDKIYPALIASQQEMGKLVKDATNPFFKSSYASLEKVLDVVKPVFLKQGIAIIQGSGSRYGGEGSTSFVGINIITRLIHESGQWIETSFPVPLSKQDAQAAGSAATYGRRYGLKAIASLAEEDDDGAAASEPDPRKDRTDDSMREITDSQLKELNHLFTTLEAKPEEIQATCRKYSGDRTESTEALMKSEAYRLIPKLRSKLKERATV